MNASATTATLAPSRRSSPRHSEGSGDRNNCAHCGLAVPRSRHDGFCCNGCQRVHSWLQDQGLQRFYALRGERGLPASGVAAPKASHLWLEALAARRDAASQVSSTVELSVGGIHCSACIWLIEELFRRQSGGIALDLNPARATLRIDATAEFDWPAFVDQVERCGYRLQPLDAPPAPLDNELLLRTGISAAIAGNAMLFAAAIFVGLNSGPIYTLVRGLLMGLALLSLLIGAPFYLRRAFAGLRRGVLTLDVPIALGMLLMGVGTAVAYLRGDDRALYADSVSAFVALMLAGQLLRQHMVARHRRTLGDLDQPFRPLARRICAGAGAVAVVHADELQSGDEVLVAPGELVPCDGVLSDAAASLAIDWLSGETEPKTMRCGDLVPRGATNLGAAAIRLAIDATTLSTIHTFTAPRIDGTRLAGWWHRVSRNYVIGILAAAAVGVGWALWRGDGIDGALQVATSVLVVTCPCALGITVPFAHEFMQRWLCGRGLLLRRDGCLERALHIRRVVLDKTGTLTSGDLRVSNPEVLARLSADEAAVLYNLAIRSAHPKCSAVTKALFQARAAAPPLFEPGFRATERLGMGMEASIDGNTFRFGAASWALTPVADGSVDDSPKVDDADLVMTVSGRLLVALRCEEELRPDAAAELVALEALGLQPTLLSGDTQANTSRVAARCSVPAERAIGDQSPTDKGCWLASRQPQSILFLGDGINDTAALQVAGVSLTPAFDKPLVATLCDAYFVTQGLGPVRDLLAAAAKLQQIVRSNLMVGALYNVAAVATAWAGAMTPWMAALLMPTSSLLLLSSTQWRLSRWAGSR